MSLKAKIEAVIYAAEEPVTLVQLAALFADEALANSAARSTKLPDPSSAEPHSGEVVDPPVDTPEDGSDGPALLQQPTEESSESNPALATALDQPTESAPSPTGIEQPDDATQIADLAAADAKRLARQREREVRDELRFILAELIDEYASTERGMEIREIAGGYRVATKPEYHDAVRGFVKSLKPPMKLSLQALETLAVIAYKQPVTAPEVSEIRGVDSGGVLGSLMSRKLITTAGRKHVVGRPILYKTTREFLLRFGLKDVSELPSIEEFEKMAGELAETDAEAEDATNSSEATLPFTGMSDATENFPYAPSAVEEADAIEEADAAEERSETPLSSSPHAAEAVEENASEPGLTIASPQQDLADEDSALEASPAVNDNAGAEVAPPTVAFDVSPSGDDDRWNEISVAPADHSAPSDKDDEHAEDSVGELTAAHEAPERDV